MPANVVTSYADKLDEDVSVIDEKWEKAQKIAKDKMGKDNTDNPGYDPEKDKSFYPYVMGIFKNMFSKEDKKSLKLEAVVKVYTTLFESSKKETYTIKGLKVDSVKTDIPPEKRTWDNMPKYADGKKKVDFKKWLNIKKPSEWKDIPGYSYGAWGKGSDGKYYGWSHRAVYGFEIGDKITPGSIGNIRKGKTWTIEKEEDAVKMAISFAKDVS